jgi:phage-related tail fiber protein
LVATTANITLSGTQTIDGVAVVAGDRVLVKSQTAPAENGIYVVSNTSWSRSLDTDTWDSLISAYTFVEEGVV